VPDPKLRTEKYRKLKISRNEARDTGDQRSYLEIERSEVKVTRSINDVTKKSAVFRTVRPTNFKLTIRMKYDDLRYRHAR